MTTLPRLVVGAGCCCCHPAPALFLPALRTSESILKLGRNRNFSGISRAASELQDTGVPGEHVVEAEGTARDERGVQFLVGSSFYREESAVGRDLACLAAAVYKKEKGRLHVLDALSGSGIRAARYLAHSQADFVWANDACDNLDALIAHNLSLASPSTASATLRDWRSISSRKGVGIPGCRRATGIKFLAKRERRERAMASHDPGRQQSAAGLLHAKELFRPHRRRFLRQRLCFSRLCPFCRFLRRTHLRHLNRWAFVRRPSSLQVKTPVFGSKAAGSHDYCLGVVWIVHKAREFFQ